MAKSKTDVQIIARLKREAPEVLERGLDFDALVARILEAVTVEGKGPRKKPHKRKLSHVSGQH